MELESQSINIFLLPENVLFKIMDSAGCCSTPNHDIRLVCKHFYKVYCTFTSCDLTFDSAKIRYDVADSMKHSLRRPSNFTISTLEDCSEGSILQQIVNHFAVHVRILRFKMYHQKKGTSLPDFEFIMRSMINVEEVTFNGFNIDTYREQLVEKFIRVPALRKIILVDCNAELADVILRVVDAPLLEAFYVQGHNEVSEFAEFFEKHGTIKTIAMSISGELPNPKAFERLQLTSLQLYFDGNYAGLHDIIASQPTLKHLNLLSDQNDVPYELYYFDGDEDTKVIVNDEGFAAVCRLKYLESLKMVLGPLQPETIEKIASLTELKELVLIAVGEDSDFDNDYDYDVNKMRNDVLYQKSFQKMIATPLPKLESFTWSSKNCEVDNEFFFSSEDEELMDADRQREYSSLPTVNIAATIASSFPSLKYLKIEMKSNDVINVRDILARFSHLKTLKLASSLTFEGEPIPMHENIKHVKISEIERNLFIEMLRLMPNLESLNIQNTNFSLDKVFLPNLQAAVPRSLKKLTLNFNSTRHQDFDVANIAILQNIVKKLHKCEIKLTGNCNFDTLAEKIDRSVNVALPRSPKWYIPGDDIGHESYMKLWK